MQEDLIVAEKTSTFKDKSIWLMICTITIVPYLHWLVKTSVFRSIWLVSFHFIKWQLHSCYPVTSSAFVHPKTLLISTVKLRSTKYINYNYTYKNIYISTIIRCLELFLSCIIKQNLCCMIIPFNTMLMEVSTV